jgi:hypothetical protein
LIRRARYRPVLAGKLARQHFLYAAGLAQFEKIRLDALFQLDDERLVAKPGAESVSKSGVMQL